MDSGGVGRGDGEDRRHSRDWGPPFLDVVDVVLGTGLSEVTDLIVVGLPCIPVSNCKYQLTCSWGKQNWLTCEVNGVVSCWLIVILIYLSLIGQLCIEPFWSKFLLRCLQYLLHPPYPYMPVHVQENYKRSPSWYQTSWKTKYEKGEVRRACQLFFG